MSDWRDRARIDVQSDVLRIVNNARNRLTKVRRAYGQFRSEVLGRGPLSDGSYVGGYVITGDCSGDALSFPLARLAQQRRHEAEMARIREMGRQTDALTRGLKRKLHDLGLHSVAEEVPEPKSRAPRFTVIEGGLSGEPTVCAEGTSKSDPDETIR